MTPKSVFIIDSHMSKIVANTMAHELTRIGYNVVSTWHESSTPWGEEMPWDTPVVDLAEVVRVHAADLVLVHASPQLGHLPSANACMFYGAALSSGSKIFFIGEWLQHMFKTPVVVSFKTIEEAFENYFLRLANLKA